MKSQHPSKFPPVKISRYTVFEPNTSNWPANNFTYTILQVVKASRDECIKECDAKNTEMSNVMSKAKEHVDNMRQDLDRITAEKGKLEKEYSALQKNNTVSTYVHKIGQSIV